MNAGQILGALWTLAFWFLLISFFVLPVVYAYWRAREKADAAETAEVLDTLLHDRTDNHIWDA